MTGTFVSTSESNWIRKNCCYMLFTGEVAYGWNSVKIFPIHYGLRRGCFIGVSSIKYYFLKYISYVLSNKHQLKKWLRWFCTMNLILVLAWSCLNKIPKWQKSNREILINSTQALQYPTGRFILGRIRRETKNFEEAEEKDTNVRNTTHRFLKLLCSYTHK